MVQIKRDSPYLLFRPLQDFISHMVQIKPWYPVSDDNEGFSLYIPYGSNKTETGDYQDIDNEIFISHMVQIKPQLTIPLHYHQLLLYIPYGSNKTVILDEVLEEISTFISHMVQIKL